MAEYIDRQAAKEQLVKTCNDVADKLYEWEGCFGYSDAVMGIVNCLDAIPAADVVERKRGRWLGTAFDGYADGYPVYYEWECSECGCVFEDEEPTYNYCHNCGADMRGKQDGRFD